MGAKIFLTLPFRFEREMALHASHWRHDERISEFVRIDASSFSLVLQHGMLLMISFKTNLFEIVYMDEKFNVENKAAQAAAEQVGMASPLICLLILFCFVTTL